MADLYSLTGDLTFTTVPGLFENNTPKFAGSTLTIDLGTVQRTDSAGLALLLEWVRLGEQQNTKVVLAHVPAQLRSMIQVGGLEELLTLTD